MRFCGDFTKKSEKNKMELQNKTKNEDSLI